jgi:peroxisome-assembly ATPase
MPPNVATGLAITNPLVKYRALVATKVISPDNGQLRLALHLQKLYDRLKDYEPQVEYSHRLDQISRAVRDESDDPPQSRSSWRTLLAAKEKRDSLELTRKLTSHESALQLSSPRGLMLHGEVGTGKSMLIDLFADCLPNRKKRRWHFNTFMLETFSKLESLRRARSSSVDGNGEQDYPLLWLARDMIQTSPILFLDEFQMPDRVASKILTNLMTSFFHLGGVLVATSNRMPEELAKASGVEFSTPPSRLDALGWQFGFRSKGGPSRGMYSAGSEFAQFLDVLKARCEVWEMEGGKDYRRAESGTATPAVSVMDDDRDWVMDGHDDLQSIKDAAELDLAVAADSKSSEELAVTKPFNCCLLSEPELDKKQAYTYALEQATGDPFDTVKFIPGAMTVYGRTITIPRTYKGITDWTFSELCKTTLGPADYITLASTYNTLILRDVPILTSLMKNEARRFITLLDALYECRCKLFITAEAGPDDLFFPEQQHSDSVGDSIQSETFSEAYQDATAPFRPNILTENPNYAEPDPEPDFTHARLAGLLNADALEDDPPNKPGKRNPFGRSFGRTDAEIARRPVDPDELPSYARKGVDFGKTSAFTGEDEKFAYKRAQSRLWEMCSSRWWSRREEGWHRPLPLEVRRWERSVDDAVLAPKYPDAGMGGDVKMGGSTVDETRDESMFRHGGSPFRTEREPPPKLSWVHAWGMMKWGAKAGAWGQGTDGLKDRGNQKR